MATGFVDGQVYTQDGIADAVLVENGIVKRVGGSASIRECADEVVDLDDRMVIPAFHDAHTHFFAVGQRERRADLLTAGSKRVALDRLQQELEEDHTFAVGQQFDETRWNDRLKPEDLNALSTTTPIMATHVTGHRVLLNDAARDVLHADSNHLVDEDALQAIGTMLQQDEDMEACVTAGITEAYRQGVTAIQDVLMFGEATAYRALDERGALPLRVTGMIPATSAAEVRTVSPYTGDRFTEGLVKVFVDGAFSARTAALSEPYPAGGTGNQYLNVDNLAAIVTAAEEKELQVAAHAIGDRAVEAVVSAVASADTTLPHRVEHAEVAGSDLFERMAAQGMIASMQPNFLQWDARMTEIVPDGLAPTNRFGTAAAHCDLAFGSDVMPFGPLYGIHHAVNAPHDSQQVAVGTAVDAYTRGAARAVQRTDSGVIKDGAVADLAVLDRSPWENTARITDLTVDMTVFDGEIVYDRRRS